MSLGNKDVEIVRLLLEHKADANVQGDRDQTTPHLAPENGEIGIMSLLLKDVDARNSRNRTQLHMASEVSTPKKYRKGCWSTKRL